MNARSSWGEVGRTNRTWGEKIEPQGGSSRSWEKAARGRAERASATAGGS